MQFVCNQLSSLFLGKGGNSSLTSITNTSTQSLSLYPSMSENPSQLGPNLFLGKETEQPQVELFSDNENGSFVNQCV